MKEKVIDKTFKLSYKMIIWILLVTFLSVYYIINIKMWLNIFDTWYDNIGTTNKSNNETLTSWKCSSEMKKEVSNQYKSPSTVKFINCEWDKTKWIYWEADAQNGFWATIRTSFLCNWDSCLINER